MCSPVQPPSVEGKSAFSDADILVSDNCTSLTDRSVLSIEKTVDEMQYNNGEE